MKRILAALAVLVACSGDAENDVSPSVTTAMVSTTAVSPTTNTLIDPATFLGLPVDDIGPRWNAGAAELPSDLVINGAIPRFDLLDGRTRHIWKFSDQVELEAFAIDGEVLTIALRMEPTTEGAVLDTAFGLVAFIVMVDPELTPSSRGEIVTELVQKDIDERIDTEATRNGIKYSLFQSVRGHLLIEATR